MKKLSRDQGREYQLFASFSFGLHRCDCPGISWMIGNRELDQRVAIQPNHLRLNISSASSAWEITGVRTLWPLSERSLRTAPGCPFALAISRLARSIFA